MNAFDEIEERLRIDLKSLELSPKDRARVIGYFNDLTKLTLQAQQGDEKAEAEMRHVKAQIQAELGIQARRAEDLLLAYVGTVIDLGFSALRRVLGAV